MNLNSTVSFEANELVIIVVWQASSQEGEEEREREREIERGRRIGLIDSLYQQLISLLSISRRCLIYDCYIFDVC